MCLVYLSVMAQTKPERTKGFQLFEAEVEIISSEGELKNTFYCHGLAVV